MGSLVNSTIHVTVAAFHLPGHVWLSATSWATTLHASLSFTISWSLFRLLSMESVMPSNRLILCHPLLFLPSVFPSIRVSSNGLALCIRWPKFWSFSLSTSPSNDIQGSFPLGFTGLISLDFQKSSPTPEFKASIPRCSAYFMIQLSHPYMTTGKIIDLTIKTFFGKVMSLLFDILSRFVIAVLPRSKCLLILWLQSPSTVILEPKKVKSDPVSTFFPIYLPWSDKTRYHDLHFLNVES